MIETLEAVTYFGAIAVCVGAGWAILAALIKGFWRA